MPNIYYEELWAKMHGLDKPYPLLAHLLDVASVANQLFHQWLNPSLREYIEQHLGPNADAICSWLAGTHDIGKANPVFQGQLFSHVSAAKATGSPWILVREAIEVAGNCNFQFTPEFEAAYLRQEDEQKRHEMVTGEFYIGDLDIDGETSALWQAIPSLGHHGRFKVPYLNPYSRRYKKAVAHEWTRLGWLQAQSALDQHVRTACLIDSESLPTSCDPSPMVLLSGITILADRLASNLSWVQRSQRDLDEGALSFSDLPGWIDSQSPHALQAIETQLGIYKGWDSKEAAKKDILGDFEPRPAQSAAWNDEEGLMTIMSATGSGKTEAAFLRHSTKNERLIFLLPTMATSNAIMRRTQKVFKNTSNVGSLAHGLASIEDFYQQVATTFSDDNSDHDTGGLFPSEFVKSGLTRMLSAVTVGTVDQALKSALPIKWVHLLMLSLANSHVVIDEVHTMDPYQAELLKVLLNWLGRMRSRVTLLSATLSKEQGQAFINAYYRTSSDQKIEYPSFIKGNSAPQSLELPNYSIDFSLHTDPYQAEGKSHIDWVKEQRRRFPEARIGVICNQIGRAQAVATALHEAGEETILLHSAMTAEHRKQNSETLERLLGPSSPDGAICVVGSQAIEASLDIDLDLLSTDLCPSTSLIQRAGRVWRREDPRRRHRVPELTSIYLHIVKPSNYENKENLPYPEAILRRTEDWLNSTEGSIKMPADCQSFVDYSTVLLSDLHEVRDELSDAYMEHFAEKSIMSSAARRRKVPLEEALDPEQNMDTFSSLTSAANDIHTSFEELATRYQEEERTFRAIAVDDSGTIPGALTTHQAAKLAESKPSQGMIQEALAGSINIKHKHIPKDSPQLMDLQVEKSILTPYRFVDLSAIYNPFLGIPHFGYRRD